jgi:hypothetical protein
MVMFRNIDTIRDAILQYMIRKIFDSVQGVVLQLKIGFLSCVSTAQESQNPKIPNHIGTCLLWPVLQMGMF